MSKKTLPFAPRAVRKVVEDYEYWTKAPSTPGTRSLLRRSIVLMKELAEEHDIPELHKLAEESAMACAKKDSSATTELADLIAKGRKRINHEKIEKLREAMKEAKELDPTGKLIFTTANEVMFGKRKSEAEETDQRPQKIVKLDGKKASAANSV